VICVAADELRPPVSVTVRVKVYVPDDRVRWAIAEVPTTLPAASFQTVSKRVAIGIAGAGTVQRNDRAILASAAKSLAGTCVSDRRMV